MSVLKIGIIGANASSGWAREAHVPAVQGLSGLALVAVATHSRDTADAAGAAFGVRAYDDGLALCEDPALDVVTVATRVPDHRKLVLAALAHGKHVYCEWPLGAGSAEAQELADAAATAGRHVVIGLQQRGNPAVRQARRLLADGAIGRPLSLNVSSATAGFGPVVAEPYLYLEEPANFANLVTIQGAHTLDLALHLMDDVSSFDARVLRQYPDILAGEQRRPQRRETFDHLLFQGSTPQGATVVLEVAGGRPPDTPFRLELFGDKGRIELLGGAPRGAQSGRLRLFVDGVEQTVEEGELTALPPAAAGVGGLYAMLRDDLRDDTTHAPDFAHAVRLTQRIESILDANGGSTAC